MADHIPAAVAQSIVEAGMLAPSGDNLQPWKLRWHGPALDISIDPARDQSLYNGGFRASVIAVGAMVENIAIAASGHGLKVDVALDAPAARPPSVRLAFGSTSGAADPLLPAIAERCTNRKAFSNRVVAPEVLAQLREAVADDDRSTLVFIDGVKQRRAMAQAASLNDRLLFEVRAMHDPLYESVRWTESEADERRDGLFIRTLELGLMEPGFRAMKSWGLVRFLNVFGNSRFAPQHSYRTFMRAPVFAFLQMTGASTGELLEGGRRMQRLWLAATRAGLSVQPMAGMLYLLRYLADQGSELEPARSVLLEAKRLFESVVELRHGGVPIMLFRLGYGPPPSARSVRRRVQETVFSS